MSDDLAKRLGGWTEDATAARYGNEGGAIDGKILIFGEHTKNNKGRKE